jgi:hypothetical protein
MNVSVLNYDISDHYPVLTEINCAQPSKPVYRCNRSFSHSNVSYFLDLLKAESWNDVFTADDYCDSFNNFYHKFLDYFNISFPLTTKKVSQRDSKKSWVTDEVRQFSSFIKNLAQRCKFSDDTEQKTEYNAMKKQYQHFLNYAKRSYNNQRIQCADNKTKEAWQIINSSKNKVCQHPLKLIETSGATIIDPHNLTVSFNNHFIQTPSHNRSSVSITASSTHSFFLTPCSKTELKAVTLSLGSKYSCGTDDIPNFLIGISYEFISSPLLFLINESFQIGIFPEPLKVAKVIPVYKNKGSTRDINSYRPISVLNVFGKIFEKLYYKRLITYLERNQMISSFQHGFRQRRSTSTACYQMMFC